MWLCILFCKQFEFEATFEETQRKKVNHASNLRIHLKTHNGEKANKCNQCDCAFSHVGDLRRHLKTLNWEKSNKCNQCDSVFLMHAIWGNIWKSTVEKSQTNATNVTLPALTQVLWGDIWRDTNQFRMNIIILDTYFQFDEINIKRSSYLPINSIFFSNTGLKRKIALFDIGPTIIIIDIAMMISRSPEDIATDDLAIPKFSVAISSTHQ